jgi:hypothetical protein
VAPADLAATVRLRLTDGARTGGLVWRYVDDRHYYAVLLNLGQSEISLYRINEGHLITLEAEDGLELDPDAWHVLKVVHGQGTIRVLLGGVRVFENDDHRNHWPDRPSRVGLIATGNSTAEFDDFRIFDRR